MNNKVLYFHKRKDTDKIFYVGIGCPERPYDQTHRNQYWHNTVNKYGYDVEIVAKNLSWDVACELEIYWIKQLKSTGVKLCNLTDGGEGVVGHIRSEKTRQLLSQSLTGLKRSEQSKQNLSKPKSEEHKQNISKSKKGIVLSDKHKEAIRNAKKNMSEETKKKISSSKTGKKRGKYNMYNRQQV